MQSFRYRWIHAFALLLGAVLFLGPLGCSGSDSSADGDASEASEDGDQATDADLDGSELSDTDGDGSENTDDDRADGDKDADIVDQRESVEPDAPDTDGDASDGDALESDGDVEAEDELEPEIEMEPEDDLVEETAEEEEQAEEETLEQEAEIEEDVETEPPLFDMDFLGDAATLNCQVIEESTQTEGEVVYTIRELRYTSYELQGDALAPIRLQAFAAIPAGGPHPGVVIAPGLGETTDAARALDHAKRLGMIAFAYAGPGQGESEGRATTDPEAMWDVIPDPRGSWLFAHAAGAIRAAGCLEQMAELSDGKIGLVGYSFGAAAGLIAAGVDSRIAAAVAISGTGSWARSADSGSWIEDMLLDAGLFTDDEEFAAFFDNLDPVWFIQGAPARVLLVSGAQDEYFPITSFIDTYYALNDETQRLTVIPDWDAWEGGWFTQDCQPFGPCQDNYDNRAVALAKTYAAERMWLNVHLADEWPYDELPGMPELAVGEQGLTLTALAGVDSGQYSIVSVTLYASLDQGWSFESFPMSLVGADIYAYPLDLEYHPDGTALFVEIEMQAGLAPNAESFWLTSLPSLPLGYVAQVRP